MGLLQDIGRTNVAGQVSGLMTEHKQRGLMDKRAEVADMQIRAGLKKEQDDMAKEAFENEWLTTDQVREFVPDMGEKQFQYHLGRFQALGHEFKNNAMKRKGMRRYFEHLASPEGKGDAIEAGNIELSDTREAIAYAKQRMASGELKKQDEIDDAKKSLQGLVRKEGGLLNQMENLGIEEEVPGEWKPTTQEEAIAFEETKAGLKPKKENIKIVPDETSSTGYRYKDITGDGVYDEAPRPKSAGEAELDIPEIEATMQDTVAKLSAIKDPQLFELELKSQTDAILDLYGWGEDGRETVDGILRQAFEEPEEEPPGDGTEGGLAKSWIDSLSGVFQGGPKSPALFNPESGLRKGVKSAVAPTRKKMQDYYEKRRNK